MESNGKQKIKVLPDGPYEVTESISLDQLRYVSDRKGASTAYKWMQKYSVEKQSVNGSYHLCRCGGSNNKPFCDGTHRTNGFKGEDTASHDTYEQMAVSYEGKFINMLDAESLCAVARFCDTHGTAWNLVEEGKTPDTKEIVIQQCANCPSGRLTAVTKEGKLLEPEFPQEISILEDIPADVHGPVWVKGGIPVEDTKGRIFPIRNRVTLCRCSLSANKPFCDGSHMKNKGELCE